MSHLDNVLRETAINWRNRAKFIHAARKSDDPVRQERGEKAYQSLIESITYETDPEILYRLMLNLAMLQDSELDVPPPQSKRRRRRS